MFKEILKKNARQIRFIGALVLCVMFIAASPTSPSDDSDCGDSGSSSGTGTIIVQNNTNARLNVSVSGPTSTGFQLSNGYQKTITANTGSYTVTAEVDQYGSPYDGEHVYSRSFTLSTNETETCGIYW